ncbi:Gr32a family protein [Megaselia abdita]
MSFFRISFLKDNIFGNFSEDNVFYVVYPLFRFFKVSGFTPLKVKVCGNNENVCFKFHRKVILLFVLMFFFHTAGFCHAVHILNKENWSQEKSKISYVASWSQIFSLFLLGSFDVISSWKSSARLMGVIQDIKKIDRQLSRLGIEVNYKRVRTIAFIQIGCLLWIPVFVSMVNCIVIRSVFEGLSSCYFFICFGPIFYITFREFQFFNLMFLLKSKVDKVNKKLCEIFKDGRLFEDAEFLNCATSLELDICEVEIEKKENGPSKIEKNNEEEQKIIKMLWGLSHISANVNESLQQVMSIFSGHLVLMTAASFTAMTVQGYNLFALLIKSLTLNYYDVTVTVVWLGIQVCIIWVNVVACHETTNSIAQTGPILHNVRGHYRSSGVLEAVQMFSLDVLHRKTRFTAGGFFTMDYNLITSIVYSLFVMGAFDTLSAWRNSKKFMDVVNSVQKIDMKLMRLKIDVSYRKERKFAFIQIGFLLLIPVFVSMVNCLVITNVFKKLSSCYFFICFVPIFFVTFREFQFFNMMFILKKKSEKINKKLLIMFSEPVKRTDNTWSPNLKVNIIDFEKYMARKLNEKDDELVDTLWGLSEISSLVHENLSHVMEIFSGHLVLLTAVSFSAMTVQGYNLFALLMSTIKMNYYNIVVTVAWLGVQMMCVWVNVVACNETANVISKTGPILHKSRGHYRTEGIIEAVQMFSLDLLHSKPFFTAGGFFKMNYSLITSILAAVTTYLVIIIQIHISNVEL